jgi:hypothetical protein
MKYYDCIFIISRDKKIVGRIKPGSFPVSSKRNMNIIGLFNVTASACSCANDEISTNWH